MESRWDSILVARCRGFRLRERYGATGKEVGVADSPSLKLLRDGGTWSCWRILSRMWRLTGDRVFDLLCGFANWENDMLVTNRKRFFQVPFDSEEEIEKVVLENGTDIFGPNSL